jgi:ankyrin repeat protein
MEPIHQAAYDGDVAAIDRLVAEDGRRLNAQMLNRELWRDCPPLMLAAYKGHDAAVARLLALGADVGLTDARGDTAAHCACRGGDHSSALAFLLNAGASINARTKGGYMPHLYAAAYTRPGSVALLIDRGGDALDLDAKDNYGWTALYWAAENGSTDSMQLLLQAGADPTISKNIGDTPLDNARFYNRQPCIPLLEAALIKPQCSRLLFKARALLDAAHATRKARTDTHTKGHPAPLQQQEAIAAAPVYLKQRVAQAQELLRVAIQHNHTNDEEEKLAACVK